MGFEELKVGFVRNTFGRRPILPPPEAGAQLPPPQGSPGPGPDTRAHKSEMPLAAAPGERRGRSAAPASHRARAHRSGGRNVGSPVPPEQ